MADVSALTDIDRRLLDIAVAEAEQGAEEGGIPIGAALAVGDRPLGVGRNRRVQDGSPVLHGEISALANAGRQSPATYRSATLYTTLSPCSMCSGAALLFGIPRVVVGENRTYQGSEDLLRARGVEVVVADLAVCQELMDAFIRRAPALWAEDTGGRPEGSQAGARRGSGVTA